MKRILQAADTVFGTKGVFSLKIFSGHQWSKSKDKIDSSVYF